MIIFGCYCRSPERCVFQDEADIADAARLPQPG